MSFAHLTLPTQYVEKTALFLQKAFGYARKTTPENSPVEVVWLDIGHGQEFHVMHVEPYATSPYEAEFGRHIALFHPLGDFEALEQRVVAAGGSMIQPLRETPFKRLFFREPVNGYIFEVIDNIREQR
jgi:predicted enzyme related to lactoylglutathione lyase